MTIEEYQNAVKTVAMAAFILSRIDIPEILDKIEMAEATGPILDPTLYRQKSEAMMQDKELLRAAIPLRMIGMSLAGEKSMSEIGGQNGSNHENER